MIMRPKSFSLETRVQYATYLPHTAPVNPQDLSNNPQDVPNDHAFVNLVDRDNSTCLKAELNGNTCLQVIFRFPDSPIGREMEVEIVVNNETDCFSYMWTWFVGSNCSEMGFLECQKSPLEFEGKVNRCIVTCQCPTPCDYLYLKFTPVAYMDQSVDQICEVYLLYGHVKPDPRGDLHWLNYGQTYNVRRTLVGNKIVDHSDVVGASPVGAVPTTSSFST